MSSLAGLAKHHDRELCSAEKMLREGIQRSDSVDELLADLLVHR